MQLKRDKIELKPPIRTVIPLLAIPLLLLLLYVFLFFSEKIHWHIVLIPAFIVSLLIFWFFSHKIVIDEDRLVYFSFFSRTVIFYSDLEGLKFGCSKASNEKFARFPVPALWVTSKRGSGRRQTLINIKLFSSRDRDFLLAFLESKIMSRDGDG